MSFDPHILTLSRSAVVDFASSAPFAIEIDPRVPGYFGLEVAFSTLVVILTGVGVCTVAPVIKIGNNATFDNLQSAATALTTTQINAAIAGAKPSSNFPAFIGSLPTPPAPVIPLGTAPYVGQMTTPASGTGGFALTGRLYLASFLLET